MHKKRAFLLILCHIRLINGLSPGYWPQPSRTLMGSKLLFVGEWAMFPLLLSNADAKIIISHVWHLSPVFSNECIYGLVLCMVRRNFHRVHRAALYLYDSLKVPYWSICHKYCVGGNIILIYPHACKSPSYWLCKNVTLLAPSHVTVHRQAASDIEQGQQ